MIKFFRKIRQKLLQENRFSKYMLYALGEIILVVIGILLALKINNWNQILKDRDFAQESMNGLKFDLTNDLSKLDTVIQKSIKDSTDLGQIRKKISQENISLDTLIHLARFEFTPWIHLGISFQKNTVTSLLSTGKISLLPREIQQSLLYLSALQNEYHQQCSDDVGIYLDNTIYYSRKYTFRDDGHIDPNSKLANVIWANATLAELGAEFNGLIGVKYSDYQGLIPYLQEIRQETNKLLDLLESNK